jgi:Na+-translocating ferredoxin:NAD+ oxidoreductase RnfA subunit
VKKPIFAVYTLFRVLWLPILFLTPILTIKQSGPASFEAQIPIVVVVPILLIEFILRKKYRKDYSKLSVQYWLITGLLGWALTVIPLLLVLPSMPLHNSNIHSPGNIQSIGPIVAMIIFATIAEALTTIPEIINRQKTVALYKKDSLFQ